MAETPSRAAAGRGIDEERFRDIKLTVSDREMGESRSCTLEEAKTWDWNNPEIWRVIGGWQITSYKVLLDVLSRKLESGRTEVEIVVAPRFTMLSGG
jgi:hypothetical protein